MAAWSYVRPLRISPAPAGAMIHPAAGQGVVACELRGTGAGPDAPAMNTVSKWRFTPALIHGKPVPCVMTVTVTIPPPR